MAKTITQEDVFLAAIEIAGDGKMPTIISVRQKIRAGSETTILKHLQSWKVLLLKSAARIGQGAALPLLDENKVLRQNLEELGISLSNYSSELQDLELANAKLQNDNSQLMQESLQNAATIAKLQAELDNANGSIACASHEYQQTLDKIILDKNHIIKSLQEEMRQIQVDAIDKMREYSFKEHDLLIHERVKIINLQTENTKLQVIVSKVKDAHLLVVEEEVKPAQKNNRAQLLSELYAQKLQSDLQIEDEPNVNNN